MFVLLCVFFAMVIAALFCFYSDATSGNFHDTSYTVTRKKEESKNENP